jgi:hypothetical protein
MKKNAQDPGAGEGRPSKGPAEANGPGLKPEGEGRPDGKNEKSLSASPVAPSPQALHGPAKESQAAPVSPAQDLESVTEAIDVQENAPALEHFGPSVETPPVPAQQPPKSGANGKDDTEEVFVILPEEGEGSQLPVVETVVVEEQPWDSNLVNTEVLKEVPAAQGQASGSLEDVPLKKVNPLAGPEAEVPHKETESIGDSIEPEEDTAQPEGEEIGAIDEIADLASELDREPELQGSETGIDQEPELHIADQPVQSHRVRTFALIGSLAAVIAVGVFFHTEIQGLIANLAGGAVSTSGSGQAQALVDPSSGIAGPSLNPQDPTEEKARVRRELRSRILLAVDVGLRAEAGKE